MSSNPARELIHRHLQRGWNKGKLWRLRLAWLLQSFAWLVAIAPLASSAATGLTIDAHGSIGPHRLSPSWPKYWSNVVTALQIGTNSIGNPATDPTAWLERTNYQYIEVIEVKDTDPRIDLGFNAWLGLADPTGAATNENNGMLYGMARILGNGSKIKLSQFHWTWADDSGLWNFTNDTAIATYNDARTGIDYGPDGKLGGGDDKIYVAGDSATNLVDEIITLAGGGFYYNQTADFPAVPDGLTHQQTLNWAQDYIVNTNNYAPSNTMGFYMYEDNGSLLTFATVQFHIRDEPTLYFARTGDQLVASWPGSGFALETSPALGAKASWTAIQGGTNTPVNIPLSGNANFSRLRKQ